MEVETNSNGLDGTPRLTAKLDTLHKLIAIIVAVVTIIASSVTTYLVFRTSTDFRLTAAETAIATNRNKIEQLEQFGHPDHERRITRLEVRADSSDRSIQEISLKLDVAVAILERIEKQSDRADRAAK